MELHWWGKLHVSNEEFVLNYIIFGTRFRDARQIFAPPGGPWYIATPLLKWHSIVCTRWNNSRHVTGGEHSQPVYAKKNRRLQLQFRQYCVR